jgi:hypothetical protein
VVIAAWSVISDGNDHQNSAVASRLSPPPAIDVLRGERPACRMPDSYTGWYVLAKLMFTRRMKASAARMQTKDNLPLVAEDNR